MRTDKQLSKVASIVLFYINIIVYQARQSSPFTAYFIPEKLKNPKIAEFTLFVLGKIAMGFL